MSRATLLLVSIGLLACTPRNPERAGRTIGRQFVEALHREDPGTLEGLFAHRLYRDPLLVGMVEAENPRGLRVDLIGELRRDFARCQFDAVPPERIVDETRIEAMTMTRARETFGGAIRGAEDDDVLVLLPVRSDPLASPFEVGSVPAAAEIDDCVDNQFVLVVRAAEGGWRIVGFGSP